MLLTHAPSTYKIPTANDCPPVFDVRLCRRAATSPTRIHRSKAIGEPPLLLPFSVFFAIRDAVSAAGGHRVDPPLAAPATSEAILRAVDRGAGRRARRDRPARPRPRRRLAAREAAPRSSSRSSQTRGSVPRERGTRMLVARERDRRHDRRRPSRAEGDRRRARDARRGERAPQRAALRARPVARPVLRRRGDARASRRSTPRRSRAGRRPRRSSTCSCTAPATSAARSRTLLADARRRGRLDRRARRGVPGDDDARLALAGAHPPRSAVDTVEAEVRQAPPGAFYLVLTHEHELDLRITEAILRRGDFAFCGLIGSKTKRARFVHRLEERGIAAERDRPPDLPDRHRRHRRQGAGGDRRRRGRAAAGRARPGIADNRRR